MPTRSSQYGCVERATADEIQWRSPEIAQEMGGIHTNTVLHYFARSPFFDPTSNNATLTTQAMYNANMFHILGTRVEFEKTLRTMQGLEFLVTHDPSEGDTKHDHSGIWVIRKEIRRRKQGMQDEVTPISSYYVVGENIYMAPSVGSIISSRLMAALTSVNKIMSTASALPSFAPATGYTYVPPIAKPPSLSSSINPTQTSKPGTPLPGGGTPMIGTQDTSKSKTSTQTGVPNDNSFRDARLFAESWDLAIRYGNDFMDENPMVGEPGSFKLSKSRELALPSISSTKPAMQPFKPEPKKAPPIKTDLPLEKYQKSGPGTAKSPITPGTAKEKKSRRKSKAAGVATPKAQTPKPSTPADQG